MITTFAGTFFDSETLAGLSVTVRAESGRLYLSGLEPPEDYSLADVRVSDRLAQVPRFLYLPDRRTVETADHDAVDALLALQGRGQAMAFVHWLEKRSRVAAAATVLVVATVVAIIWLGLPVLARNAALAVPPSIEQQAGQVALATFNRLLGASQMGPVNRLHVERLLDRLVQAQGGSPRRLRLEFRSMGGRSPNAFALPGGTIVVSDELVLLANDQELMAVLAHEFGHIERRHGLQSLLRNSAALLVVSTATGDLSTLTSFSGTIPFILLQRGYSREFEEEADDYAVDLLRKAKVNPVHFATILKKLEDSRPSEGNDFTYLATHPGTADRIRRIISTGTSPVAAGNTVPAPVAADSSEFDDEVVTIGGPDVISPRALDQPGPDYPPEMAALSLTGEVTVEFIIDRKGNVRSPRIVRSTRREFEAPAVAAVMRWKFSPGQKGGRFVAIRASQTLEFNMDDQAPADQTGQVPLPLELRLSRTATSVPPK